jgi:starch synthase
MLNYAFDVYSNRPKLYARLQQNAMAENFSWAKASKQYVALYNELLQK